MRHFFPLKLSNSGALSYVGGQQDFAGVFLALFSSLRTENEQILGIIGS